MLHRAKLPDEGKGSGGSANTIEKTNRGFVIGGVYDNYYRRDTGNDGYDGWIVEIDLSGNQLRDKFLGGLYMDEIVGVYQINENEFVIGGYQERSQENHYYPTDNWAKRFIFN